MFNNQLGEVGDRTEVKFGSREDSADLNYLFKYVHLHYRHGIFAKNKKLKIALLGGNAVELHR